MIGMLMLVALALATGLMMSTREQRKEARRRVNRWARWLWIPTLALWAMLLFDRKH